MAANKAYEQLQLAAYLGRLGGEGSPERDRFWLAWNYEVELVFEKFKPSQTQSDSGDNRKLIRATLFKNGRPVAISPE